MKPTNSQTDSLSRRDALRLFGTIGAVALAPTVSAVAPKPASSTKSAQGMGTSQPFTLPPLTYAYDALEPHIDSRTMEIHHTKHHQAYIDNANKVLADQSALRGMTAETILAELSVVPEAMRTPLRNNVGGHVNHSLFWRILAPGGSPAPVGRLSDAIAASFGSFESFKVQFADSAAKRFGSGWAWLAWKDGRLQIISTANQDSPLMEQAIPVLGLDVWEHAYYLKYQNRRPDYISAFWRVANWDVAEMLFRGI